MSGTVNKELLDWVEKERKKGHKMNRTSDENKIQILQKVQRL